MSTQKERNLNDDDEQPNLLNAAFLSFETNGPGPRAFFSAERRQAEDSTTTTSSSCALGRGGGGSPLSPHAPPPSPQPLVEAIAVVASLPRPQHLQQKIMYKSLVPGQTQRDERSTVSSSSSLRDTVRGPAITSSVVKAGLTCDDDEDRKIPARPTIEGTNFSMDDGPSVVMSVENNPRSSTLLVFSNNEDHDASKTSLVWDSESQSLSSFHDSHAPLPSRMKDDEDSQAPPTANTSDRKPAPGAPKTSIEKLNENGQNDHDDVYEDDGYASDAATWDGSYQRPHKHADEDMDGYSSESTYLTSNTTASQGTGTSKSIRTSNSTRNSGRTSNSYTMNTKSKIHQRGPRRRQRRRKKPLPTRRSTTPPSASRTSSRGKASLSHMIRTRLHCTRGKRMRVKHRYDSKGVEQWPRPTDDS